MGTGMLRRVWDGVSASEVQGAGREGRAVRPHDRAGFAVRAHSGEELVVLPKRLEHRAVQQGLQIEDLHLPRLEGEFDDVPEQAFFNVGGIDDLLKKSEQLKAQG